MEDMREHYTSLQIPSNNQTRHRYTMQFRADPESRARMSFASTLPNVCRFADDDQNSPINQLHGGKIHKHIAVSVTPNRIPEKGSNALRDASASSP
jgi:hypothetical protein